MKKNSHLGLLLVFLFCAGCASTGARQSATYPMSYDQTFLVALDALNNVGGWKVSSTDQLNGLIVLQKGGFFVPRRSAKLIVKRVAPFSTRVELDDSSRSKAHGNFLDAIDHRVENRALTYPN